MPAIITDISKIFRAINFYNKATNTLTATETLYLGVGRTTAWTDENNPPVPDSTMREIEELQFIKRIDRTSDANINLVKNGGRVILKVVTGNTLNVGDTIKGESSGTIGEIVEKNVDVDSSGLDWLHVLTYENVWQVGENLTTISGNSLGITISDKDETYHNIYYFRNTLWEIVTLSDTQPSTPKNGDYWWDTTVNILKTYDESTSTWVIDNSISPKWILMRVKLNANEGLNTTYRQIGILETPKDTSGNIIYDTIKLGTDVGEQGILHYVNNIQPVSRSVDQNEIISIIIEF